jgi:hypothetical protein
MKNLFEQKSSIFFDHLDHFLTELKSPIFKPKIIWERKELAQSLLRANL